MAGLPNPIISVHTGHLMNRGIRVIGQCNGSKKDIAEALALSNEGIVPEVGIVELAAIDEALDKLKCGQANGRQVLVFK